MGLFDIFKSKGSDDTMADTKIAVIYYSSTGTNHKMAKWAVEGAEAAGAEVKLLRVEETAPAAALDSNPAWREHYEATKDIQTASTEDLEWADGIIFSMPTRFGNLPAQLKQYIDTTGGLWAQGKLVNKVVSGMSSASNPHGGQEATILALYTSMMHWGAIIASPGYSDPITFTTGGNPYGTSATVGQDGNIVENIEEAVKHQAKRTVQIASGVKQIQPDA
ncbi:NAD(P)H:quinone oxidoreductase [Sinobaca sp. H24]|uniref:NAD(P)H:quinone oxidoreductase n=1 Tax=Sinobaca sp. H24 TaxID=2923376 RepID=UPI0035B3ED3D